MIADQIKQVEKRVQAACDRAGRKRNEVEIIAVSKSVPADSIERAYKIGIRLFGENYVQEWSPKYEMLKKYPDLRWHFIGALQSNKTSKLVGKVDLIHSVDRWSLVSELHKQSEKNHLPVSILLELNIAGEKSKSGVHPDQFLPLLKRIQKETSLQVKGMMVFPPLDINHEITRSYFLKARDYFISMEARHLSMGTSQDYEIAIEAGATLIRVGTAIFGERTQIG